MPRWTPAQTVGQLHGRPRRHSSTRTSARYIRSRCRRQIGPAAARPRCLGTRSRRLGLAGRHRSARPLEPGAPGPGPAALAANAQHPVAAVGVQVLYVHAGQLRTPRPVNSSVAVGHVLYRAYFCSSGSHRTGPYLPGLAFVIAARPDMLGAGGLRAGLGSVSTPWQGPWVNGLDTAQRSTTPHATRLHVIDVTQVS